MEKPNKREEIEEILTDAYGEYEQMSAWECVFTDSVQTPCRASLLGKAVEVTEFRTGPSETLQCQVKAGSRQRWIAVEDLDEEGLPEDLEHYRRPVRILAGRRLLTFL